MHLGGTLDEIAASERAAARGDESAERPFVLLAQPSLFDATRAPPGKHTAWAYCHVPNGSAADMTTRIEQQVERFAPGFRARILARSVLAAERNSSVTTPTTSAATSWAVRTRCARSWRARSRFNPYTIPVKGWYLCSASTPPGGGVHGMAGFNAAQAALKADG